MPVLPGISDQREAIAGLVARAADCGVDFVLFGGLTLRPGRQKDHYLALIHAHHPELVPGYLRVYRRERESGAADPRYYERVDDRFREALERHGLPSRIPRRLFAGKMPQYAELAVLLEHREAAGEGKGLGRVGHTIQAWARGRRGTVAEVERELRRHVEHASLDGIPAAA